MPEWVPHRIWREWSFVAVGDGLGDDADVGDTGLAKGIDDGTESTEGNGLIGSEKDGVVRVFGLLSDFVRKLVNVDGIVAEIDALIFVDGNDEFLFGDFLDGVGFGDIDFNAGLKNGSGNHEDDEKDEDDIDKGDHIDVGKRGLRGFGKCRHGDLSGILAKDADIRWLISDH
jgi:hypothetical protein